MVFNIRSWLIFPLSKTYSRSERNCEKSPKTPLEIVKNLSNFTANLLGEFARNRETKIAVDTGREI